jgi:hypothetical protein
MIGPALKRFCSIFGTYSLSKGPPDYYSNWTTPAGTYQRPNPPNRDGDFVLTKLTLPCISNYGVTLPRPNAVNCEDDAS